MFHLHITFENRSNDWVICLFPPLVLLYAPSFPVSASRSDLIYVSMPLLLQGSWLCAVLYETERERDTKCQKSPLLLLILYLTLPQRSHSYATPPTEEPSVPPTPTHTFGLHSKSSREHLCSAKERSDIIHTTCAKQTTALWFGWATVIYMQRIRITFTFWSMWIHWLWAHPKKKRKLLGL